MICATEDEARARAEELIPQGKWPVYFFGSDTTGEKAYEEFFMGTETLDLNTYRGLGVIKNKPDFDSVILAEFESTIDQLRRSSGPWDKTTIVNAYLKVLPELTHEEKGKYLDSKM